MDKFLPNPSLTETDTVNANVIFKRLEVEGDIIIENNFNGHPFNETLNDLVYKVIKYNCLHHTLNKYTLKNFNSMKD